MSGGPVIELRDARILRAGVTVLEVPSFAVDTGETVALIGPNGCGKTTLMLALAALLRPASGALRYRGAPVASGREELAYRRRCAMVFQDPLLFHGTVYHNVASGLAFRGRARGESARAVAECLERFNLSHLSDRPAAMLSGGEAQRTSLARAFAVSPEIVFLDEPFTSLDPRSRAELVGDLRRIVRETGTTLVLVTHNRDEALTLAGTTAVLGYGTVIQRGRTEEVLNAPADEFVASFSGMETVLLGTVAASGGGVVEVAVPGGRVEAVSDAPLGEEVALCVRPENVSISLGGAAPGTSVRNSFDARVEGITTVGLYARVRLDCGFSLISFVTLASVRELGLDEGLQVRASFKATAVHVIRKGA